MIQIVLLRTHEGRVYHKHPDGFPTGLVVSNTDALFVNLGAIIEKLRNANPDNLNNVYYTVAHHAGLGVDKPVRTELSYETQTVLPFDIDHVDQGRAWDYLPIAARILGVSPQSLIFSSTGNGLHILAHLKTPIRSTKYLKETKPHYNEVVYKLQQALEDARLPGNVDPSIWDAARILRLPNTINQKPGGVKESKLLQYPGLIALDLDIIKLSGLDKLALEQLSPAHLKRTYPRPDFQQVVTQCEFMKWALEHPEQVHEPHYMSITGLLGAIQPGDKAEYKGEEKTAKEIAEEIFNGACNSQSLQRGDFDRKWEHGIRYGAPKCQTVSNNWPGGCEKCPHFNKITTPLALKSEEHISSAANGYWVMGKNGPIHPHYTDLARIYKREHSFVACEPDRIFTFEETHYKPTGHLKVKSWLDKKVGFEDKLRDAHCVEFLKKILRSGTLTELEEGDLFEQTIRGKLNCQNGVVDVKQGQMIEHAPVHGFKYVLPYNYEPGQASEFFLDWLAQMMENRTELMDAVLDMMAYCLWPTYDDHVFAYLVGEGSNGKSTLLHIIQELVGKSNYSAISLSQMAKNRFSPANLEGKLVNVSGESSGGDLTLEELNILKDLSAGDELEVERKNQQGFTLKSYAKLIFAANKTPRFHEQGKAIRRRMLVIPFDHQITREDPSVEDKLLQEIPKICSMLVSRIQENLKENNGKFKVSRGGNAGSQAQDRVLLAGNNIVEWGKECVESSVSFPETKYISCQEAYKRYTCWCQENNHKPANSIVFGRQMMHGVLNGDISATKVIRVGGKGVRVYPRAQWKEEIV